MRATRPVVVLFSDGPLRAKLEESGVETHILLARASLVNSRKDTLGIGALTRVRDITATLALSLRLKKFISSSNIEIIHTNSLKADIIGGLAGRLAGKRVIWHVRDRIADDYLPRKIVRLFRFLAKIVPHLVICNSNATLRTLVPHSCTDTQPDDESLLSGSSRSFTTRANKYSNRFRVVHDGTVPPADPPPNEPAGASPLIGIVGRISPWKGQDIFLRAAAVVRQRFPEVRFAVIGGALFGEKDFELKLHGLVDELHLADAVEFTGFRSDVLQLISRLDVLVHASTTAEPFGQVVIEGMAAGKPVIATDGGGIPEIVLHHVTGLLVPMGDQAAMANAMEFLLADPTAAAEMGVLGRRRVSEQFTIGHTAARVQAIYERMLGYY